MVNGGAKVKEQSSLKENDRNSYQGYFTKKNVKGQTARLSIYIINYLGPDSINRLLPRKSHGK